MSKYEVIVIGAGSIGTPIALALAEKKINVLVIDAMSSPGQGQNKRAIGGIRATHSDKGKIKVCQRSIEIFSNWKEKYGDHIGWIKNGYSFPVYSKEDEIKLKNLLKIQKSFGLNIDWVSAEEYKELVPGINENGLRGATYSPDDGSASPLLANSAFYFKSQEFGGRYKFKEKVVDINVKKNNSIKVVTNKSSYHCNFVVNASGNFAAEIGKMVDLDLYVVPDSHEGGITEPVARFFGPMIVDMRPTEDSVNFYFYQNNEGQVIFCITPKPPIYGTDCDSTSLFLPQVAGRMIELFPKLANIKVRRTWRGQYQMTPDGFPIVGALKEAPGFINAVGMCGQGFMIGPGLGEIICRIISNELSEEDREIIKHFDLYRDFSQMEQFK